MTSTPDLQACDETALQDYAALGDGRSVALVAADGTIAWWCAPNLDSGALFDSLIDPQNGGRFRIAPASPFEVERRYRADSNVLETIFTTATGVVRMTESLNSTLAGRLPWSELARRLEAVSGVVPLAMRLTFATRAGTVAPSLQRNPNGCIFHAAPVIGMFRCTPNVRITHEEGRTIEAQVTLASGACATFAILAGADEPLGVPDMQEIDERIDISDAAWRGWARGLRYDGPHRDVVRRSALALKLLLFSPSGAIAAAATTSLPERIGGGKNYDYRYAWVRDAAYTVNAFLRLGVVPESKAAFTWLIQRIGESGSRVCFTLAGGRTPRVVKSGYPGYRGSRPVVTGNAATTQRQHGVYGDIFETAWLFVAAGHVLDGKSAAILAALADECAARWRRRDSGMWELEERQHYTMSKISCWQALARAAALAEAGHIPAKHADRWARERDAIIAWVDEHCWSHDRCAYVFHPGSERLDASLALAARFGFPDRERLSSTLDAIRGELAHGPLVYRYCGAQAEEGAFLACTFWLVEAYATLGRREEAVALFDEALAAIDRGVGVLSEMIDVASRDFLGNIPQGLSHLALIHAACSLEEPDRRSIPRGGDG